MAIRLGSISAANMVAVFLFQWYVLAQLGPGTESDAFFASMTVPQLVLAIISSSLVHVLVPLLSGRKKSESRNDSWAFLILIGGTFTFIALFLIALAPLWVPLSVPGFEPAGKALTTELTRIQTITMTFAAINAVQLATYHAQHKFLWTELSSLLANLLSLAAIYYALHQYGVFAAAWISVFRVMLQTIFLLPGMGKPIVPDFRVHSVRIAWTRVKPLLAGNAYYKTEPLLDRFLLSMAISGNLSIYYMAQQGYAAVAHVLNRAIASPLVPRLSVLFKDKDLQAFEKLYYTKLAQVGLICIAGLVILLFFGTDLLKLFTGYGSFRNADMDKLWWVLVWLSGMLIGAPAGQIASTAFYSVGDTVTPTRMSMITYTAYIPLKLAAFYVWGLSGLAIITSIYYVANLSIQMYLIARRWAHVDT